MEKEPKQTGLKYKLRKMAIGFGFGAAALVLLTAVIVDRTLGQGVLIISPHDPSTVELNRALYAPGDSVAELYGNPLSKPVRVILPSPENLIRPEEDTSLLLLRVDKQKGENPLQAKTIWFFGKFAVIGLSLIGLAGFALPRPKSV